MKKVMICGATGMVGHMLAQTLNEQGYSLILVGRDVVKTQNSFPFKVEALSWDDLDEYDTKDLDVIVNLAGASVADVRWTDSYKTIMQSSRFNATDQCVKMCQKNSEIQLISASSVHAYGAYEGDHEPFSENDRDKRVGTLFLQELIDTWEEKALKAQENGNNVILLRLGVVLGAAHGALPMLKKQFQMFMGGPAGSGKQIMSWISLRDVVGGIIHLIERPDITGPVNFTSPGACTNNEFAKALGKALSRPSFMRTPAPILRAVMGQRGQELVLTGQRVTPKKLIQSHFTFQDNEINSFFHNEFA